MLVRVEERRQPQHAAADASWGSRFRREFRSELSSVRYPNFGEAAAGFVIGATLILLAGGAIQAIRVDHAGLPVTEALSAMPRELFFVVGAKEIALRVAVYWAAYAVLRPAGNIDRQMARAGESHWRLKLATGNEWIVGVFYGGAVVIALTSHWGWGAVWGAFTLLVVAIVVDRGIPVSFGVLLIAGAVFAAGQVVARELDAPVKLNRATVETQDSGAPVEGLLVAETGSAVHLGQHGLLVSIPIANVSRVTVSDPPPGPPPEDSLVSKAINWVGKWL